MLDQIGSAAVADGLGGTLCLSKPVPQPTCCSVLDGESGLYVTVAGTLLWTPATCEQHSQDKRLLATPHMRRIAHGYLWQASRAMGRV